jgi:hypothetical protein
MGISAIASFFATQGITSPMVTTVATTVVPVLVKIGVDALDFYTSDVKL